MKSATLSGSDHLRSPTMTNHTAYANHHGYRYIFDIVPKSNRTNTYHHRLLSISEYLVVDDWLFWIDDDAAFTQLDRSFESLLPELARNDLSAVFCASPINPAGGWTYLSSGIFCEKRWAWPSTLSSGTETSLSTVQPWWNQETLGMTVTPPTV